MKRVVLALLLGSVFTIGCGQRLVELAPDDDNTPAGQAPVLTGILPQRGPAAGGTSVVLTGANLTGTSEVSFGDTAATSFTVNSATQVTAVSPAGTSSVNVTVVTSAGRSNGLPFAYGNAPVITGITPAFGLAGGGTSVTITGSGLTDASSVTFGGTAVSAYTVVSDSQITTTAPAHAAGAVAVVVTTPIAASNDFTFTYGEAPTVASITPDAGPTTGGTAVTLTGANFTGATQVTFDSTVVTAITVVDATTITLETPAHAVGVAAVSVTTPFGSSTGIDFTYGLAPTITAAAPDSSATIGGDTIILAGTNLTGTTAVTFGTVEATTFTVNSDTQITVTSPPGTSSVNVTATTRFGTSNGFPFGYGNAPVLQALNPVRGLIAGGDTVVLTGLRFTGATAVTFDGLAATNVTVDSATQITLQTPAHGAGPVDVIVTTPEGASNTRTFTYGSLPTISGAVPNFGPNTGGTPVVLEGTDFSDATSVSFGLAVVPAANFTVDSATQITVASPAAPGIEGDVSIVVTTPFGASSGTTFTYGAVPAITQLSPATGDVGGNTTVTITGTGLTDVTAVQFGSVAATSFTNVSATSLTAVSPPGTGSANVSVQTRFGTSNTLPFTYGNGPTITGLVPAFGPVAGTNTVLINGTNFTSTSTVLFGSTSFPTPTFVSDTQLSVVAPANGAPGTANVTVTNDVGTSAPSTYTYGEAPTVTGVSPGVGPLAGGTPVTITGTNLASVTGVTFAGAEATIVGTPTATSLTVNTPIGTAGTATVVVTTPFGSASGAFTYVAAPTVSSIAPISGTTGGGTVLLISGANLATASSVTIGGTIVSVLTNVTDTSFNVTTPAHAAGNVDVIVQTAGGSVTVTDGFSYVAAAPTITTISPSTGDISGGTTVIVTGTNFTVDASVTFDGVSGTNVVVTSATQLTVVTPAHAAGAAAVVVTTSGGASAPSPTPFTYAAGGVTLTSITPATAPNNGGTSVTLTGTNLAGVTSVTFGGTAATNVVAVNATTVTATTPARAAGVVDVVASDGTSNGTLVAAFTLVGPGTITDSTDNPGILIGTGLAWLGTDPTSYAVFSCLGSACDINDDIDVTIDGPITSTSFNVGSGAWTGYTGAICPAGTTTWSAIFCTNQFFSAP